MAEISSYSQVKPTRTEGTVDVHSLVRVHHAQVPLSTTELTEEPVVRLKTQTAGTGGGITELFAAIRLYGQTHQKSVLELIAEYALDDLPISIAQTIKYYLEERKPQVKPGEVNFTGLFSSGRSDLSERMEEIIYGADSGDDA